MIRAIPLLGALFLTVASETSATPVTFGEPVSGPGSGTPVGTVDATTQAITFFIPFAHGLAGSYGVGGVGLQADRATPSASDHVGALDLWLRFAPPWKGPATVTLDFTDLDLLGGNDPTGFREELAVFDAFGATLLVADDSADAGVVFADSSKQLIAFAVTLTADPLFLRLRLSADSGAFLGRRLRNTPEDLVASVHAVPLPHTFALLLGGLLAMLGWRGGTGWRRRRDAD